MDIKLNYTYLITLLSGVFPLLSVASGFQEWQQSVISLGLGHADMAAAANHTSTAYYNPAGMTNLDQSQITAGAIGVRTNTNVDDVVITGPNFSPVAFPNSKTHETAAIPNFHAVLAVDNPYNLRFGLSLVGPYGGKSHYDNPLIQAYTKDTSLEVLEINPSFAFTVFEKLSIGAGIGFEQIKTDLTSDLKSSLFNLQTDVHLDGWKTTWNVGLLYEFTPHTRAGVTYRPQIDHHQTGDIKLTSGDDTYNPKAANTLNLPATTTFGFFHDLTDKISVMATAAYTEWSSVEDFNIDVSSSGAVSSLTTPFNWKNTWFFGIGGDYKFLKDWVLRTGLSYDRTPTNNTDRELRAPDSDQYGAAVGLGYSILSNLQIDFAYQYIYTPSVQTSNPLYPNFFSIEVPVIYNANPRSYAQFMGMQLTWEFGRAVH